MTVLASNDSIFYFIICVYFISKYLFSERSRMDLHYGVMARQLTLKQMKAWLANGSMTKEDYDAIIKTKKNLEKLNKELPKELQYKSPK